MKDWLSARRVATLSVAYDIAREIATRTDREVRVAVAQPHPARPADSQDHAAQCGVGGAQLPRGPCSSRR